MLKKSLAVLMFMLVGCGNSVNGNIPEPTEIPATNVRFVNQTGRVEIHGVAEVQVNGVRCFIFDGRKAGNMECDWDAAKR